MMAQFLAYSTVRTYDPSTARIGVPSFTQRRVEG